MATHWYTHALTEILKGTFDLTATLKAVLLKSSYVWDADHDQVSDLAEIVATGYTGGYGGGGRQTVTVSTVDDHPNDRVCIGLTDVSWASLGGAVNDTLNAVALVYETGGGDGTSIPVAYIGVASWTTDGGSFAIDFLAAGNLFINVV